MTRITTPLLAAAALVMATACQKPAATSAASGTPAAGVASSPTAPAIPPPPKPMPAQLPDVLARVNGEAVSKVDFDRLIKNMELSAGQPVPPERRDELFRQALDQLVTYTVLKQETATRHVTVTETDVESQVTGMRGKSTDEEFQKALAARGMTIEQLRSDARVDLSIKKMMGDEVASVAGPSDAQIREFYDKNPDKFKQPEAVRASHILIKVDEKADAATRTKALARAESVLKQAKSGADFAGLAKRHSQDAGSAAQGGDLEFFSKDQFSAGQVPPTVEAAFGLQTGQVSGVVTSPFGYHIIKVTDRRAATTVAFEQVGAQIRDFLSQQYKQDKATAVVESLKKKAKIEVLV